LRNILILGSLIYYPKKGAIYKVNDLQEEDGKIKGIKLMQKDTSELLELTAESEISTLRDHIFINIKFSGEGYPILNLPCRLGHKLETELSESVKSGTGKSFSAFKIFQNKSIVDKEILVFNLKDAKDEMYLFATIGFSTEYTYLRFKINEYTSPYWYSGYQNIDAIMFIPNTTVFL
jgi:hypothetical protein